MVMRRLPAVLPIPAQSSGPVSNFTLYLRGHRAGQATTCRQPMQLQPQTTTRTVVVEYPRRAGELPYTVVHDPLVHRPYGSFRVYIGGQPIGSQLSYPGVDDCLRMERA